MKRLSRAFFVLVFLWMNSFLCAEGKEDLLHETPNQSNLSGPQTTKKVHSGGIRGLNDPKKRRYSRRLASERAQNYRPTWYLGITSHFEGPLAKISGANTLSRGLGYGGGLSIEYQMPTMRFNFQPSYRYLRLGRALDGSGVNQDSTVAQVTQTNGYVGLAGYLSFLMETGGGINNPWDPSWWTDIGTEFLFPISSSQTSAFAENLDLKADKLWFILVGGTLDFAFPGNWVFKTRLHLFYNLPSTSEGRLFGVRAQIAFDFGLL